MRSSLIPTIALAFIAVLLMLTPISSPAIEHATPVTSTYDAEELLAIKPDLREEIAAALSAGMPEYTITAELFDFDDLRSIEGEMTLTYTNTTGEVLDELPLRMWANSAARDDDAIEIDDVQIDGRNAEFTLSDQNSIAMIALPQTLAPNEMLTLDLTFTSVLPNDSRDYYGMYNYETETGSWAMAHWYPMLPGRDPITGWELRPTSVNGDPVFTDTGLYDVTTIAPEDLTLITSGVVVEQDTADGITTTVWNAKPSRDFVMFADGDMISASHEVDGTEIISWAEPSHEDAADAVLAWTVDSVELFNELLGEYPYQTLQAFEAEMYWAAGVEYPQMFAMSSNYYDGPVPGYESVADAQLSGANRLQIQEEEWTYFEFTVAHEVVHMWFYNLVGNNQYQHAYMDESLTQYLSAYVYFREVHGKTVADDVYQYTLTEPFAEIVETNRDVIVDHPTDDFASGSMYTNAVYTKGAVGFGAIHEELGDEAFFAGLQSYVEDFRFHVATPDDLLAAWQAQTDTDLEPLWVHWFERREGGLDIRD